MEQVFVVDGKETVANAMKAAEKTVGAPIVVKAFMRIALGEGIDKATGRLRRRSRGDDEEVGRLRRAFAGRAQMAGTAPRFKRLLLKLSGEALMGRAPRLRHADGEPLRARHRRGARARHRDLRRRRRRQHLPRPAGGRTGMPRGTADYMGMLATVMNALALRGVLEAEGVPARVMSAIPMPTVCESFSADKARHHLAKGRVVIFGGGTGNPFFTTDTTAALRAAEMGCDAIAKATQVDGIYSADPKKDPNAKRYDTLTYAEVLERDLKVMDGAAIALARDNGIPIIVFSIREDGNLVKLLKGEARATIVR